MALREILRLTPWSVRRRIFATVRAHVLPRVAEERRLPIARALLPLGSGRARRADGAVLRVRTPAGTVTARVDAGTTPAEVRRRNLDRVVRALDEAGADWFRVPHDDPMRTAVAVPETARATVLPLLRRLTAADHGALRSHPAATGHGALRERRREAGAVSVCWPVTDPGGDLVLGHDLACEVEFWREQDGALVAPRGNPVAASIPAGEPPAVAAEPVFGPFCAPDDATAYRTRAIFAAARPDRIDFDIDVVCTGTTDLRHTLRALHCHAPWVRRVFLATGETPDWLDLSHPRLTVVAGATRPHLIADLAEHFLHFGDGMLLGRPVTPDLFFTSDGLPRFFPPADTGPAGPRPADRTGNDRRQIGEAFSQALTRRLPRVPQPSRRGVLTELESRFPQVGDMVLELYAYLTGKAVIGDIRHRAVDPDPLDLALLLHSRDADALHLDASGPATDFLAAYLPFVSPFELQHRNTRAIAAPRRPGDRPVPPDVALPPVA
ncbi:hypothetical protein [Actinoplanes utahensis]|uniref:Uncharacterized protein n=1 Tax=Actinoplanes utahensis TaxID=1869 RepID=A0A0A6UCL6_ACTUT|nr:hypothetical protein [Actinoplanes utahensis]KHD73231.1 hypothetical protein MB27_36860 [Actinoplanes utahensis]GIF34856.1 exopolysaccharide phosphotransferase [Actinoplanes utahensis]